MTFHDPDSGNTHTITWDWGDGSSNDVQPNAISPAARTLVYAEQGVYSAVFEFIVIFDATNGFVTGGGWYGSPAGTLNFTSET